MPSENETARRVTDGARASGPSTAPMISKHLRIGMSTAKRRGRTSASTAGTTARSSGSASANASVFVSSTLTESTWHRSPSEYSPSAVSTVRRRSAGHAPCAACHALLAVRSARASWMSR